MKLTRTTWLLSYGVDQDDLAAVILYLACRNYKVLSFISYMWHARFN